MRLGTLGIATLAVAGIAAAPRQVWSAQQQEEVRHHTFLFAHGGGHLGIALDEVSAKTVEKLKLKEERGAFVREVRADSPADKAGLKVDDVIVAYQGLPVESAMELTRRVRETPPGRVVTIEVIRQGAPLKLTATLDELKPQPWGMQMPNFGLPSFGMPDADLPPMPGMQEWPRHKGLLAPHGPQKLGIEYQEISGQFAEYFRVQGQSGLLVVGVVPDGPAAKAGVKVGDILVRLGKEDVADGGDLRQALAQASPGDELSVTVQRDGRPIELKLVVGGATAEPGQAPVKEKKKQRQL
jgi:serine protease Do